MARYLLVILIVAVSACSGGSVQHVVPQTPPAVQSTPPPSGTIVSSAPAPSSVHFASVTTPEQTAGGIAIGSDGMVYLNGVSGFLKYMGVGFAQYPYIFAPGESQVFVPIPGLRAGPGQTVWTATEQCCSLPTGYDFQYFESVTTLGNVAVSGLVSTTHFDAGITSFAPGSDGNMWTDTFCNPAVCGGTEAIVLVLDASFNQSSGPAIPDFDVLGEMTSGPDGAMYAVDYKPSGQTEILRIDVHTRTVTRSYHVPSFMPGEITEITSGPDGALWFTASRANRIGRLKLGGTFASYAVPTANAGVGGIAAASDNALWFTETNANKIGRIALDGSIHEYPIPASAGPIGITAGAPSCTPGTIYFTETNALGILTF
jgi:streptogramin lyase